MLHVHKAVRVKKIQMLKNKLQIIQVLLAKVERYEGHPSDANFLSIERTASLLYEMGFSEGYEQGEIDGIEGMLNIEKELFGLTELK